MRFHERKKVRHENGFLKMPSLRFVGIVILRRTKPLYRQHNMPKCARRGNKHYHKISVNLLSC